MFSFPLIDPPLDDGVARLRVMEEDEYADFLSGVSFEDIADFAYSGRRFDEESARDYVRSVNGERRLAGQAVQLSIRDRDGDFLGVTLLFRADWDRQSLELGFWLMPHARGSGVGRRAVALTCGWALDLGFERIEAHTDVDNLAAQRTMERCGFGREGILRGFGPDADGDGRRDYIAYGLLRADFNY